jgi:hypothetical protein
MAENDRIRLGPEENVELAATVLVECFTPSNINNLLSAIDSWPIQPAEYREDLKKGIRDWRNAQYGNSWRRVALLARPGARVFEASRDPTIPEPIKAVELMLISAAPSLTLLAAIFYPEDGVYDLSERLRRDFGMRVDNSHFALKGRFAKVRALNPWSRAKTAVYSINFSVPSNLQREWCKEKFDEFDAYCWHWLRQRAPGKLAELSLEQRPAIRVVLTEEIEPFGPIDDEPITIIAGEPAGDRLKERMLRRHGPLDALGLDGADYIWTSPERDTFYFSLDGSWSESSIQSGILSAQKSTVRRLINEEGDFSTMDLVSYLARHFPDLFTAWATEQLLAKYKDDVAAVRDSSGAPRTALKTAQRLNTFLTADGHDAAIVTEDVIRNASTGHSLGYLPAFVDLNMMRFHESLPDDDPQPLQTVREHYRDGLRKDAEIVAAELALTKRSIETSAQLLQSIAAIRLQWASLLVAVVAAVIAISAILVA